MKVAVLDQSNFAAPYDDALCTGLADVGLQTCLVCRPPRDKESLPAADTYSIQAFFFRFSTKSRVESLPGPVRGFLKAIEYAIDLWRFEKSELPGYDVIHIQWSLLPFIERFFFPRWQNKKAVIMTVHDTVPFQGKPTSILQVLGWRKLIQSMNHLIVHTRQGSAALVEQGINEAAISTIPHGVLERRNAPSELPAIEDIGDRVTILMFGHIKPYKGLYELIEAVKISLDSVSVPPRLVVAGKLYFDESAIRDRVREFNLDSVVDLRPGFIEDDELDRLIMGSDIVAFPYSMVEASGALLTTLPFGKAILATRVGVFDEILTHEQNSLLIESNRPQLIAGALVRLCNDSELRHSLARGAMQLAAEFVSWTDIGRATLELYRESVNHPG